MRPNESKSRQEYAGPRQVFSKKTFAALLIFLAGGFVERSLNKAERIELEKLVETQRVEFIDSSRRETYTPFDGGLKNSYGSVIKLKRTPEGEKVVRYALGSMPGWSQTFSYKLDGEERLCTDYFDSSSRLVNRLDQPYNSDTIKFERESFEQDKWLLEKAGERPK